MVMKQFSPPRLLSRAKVRNVMLLNLLATPGLGTLAAGRWVEGFCQLGLSVAGFVALMVWFVRQMIPYYGMMFGDSNAPPVDFFLLKLGAALFLFAWVWSLFTGSMLSRQVSQQEKAAIQMFGAGQVRLSEPQILQSMAAIPDWQRQDEVISRVYAFKDFPAAIKFVNSVALHAEQVQHHPDLDIRWNKVFLKFTTHDAGALTEKDFAMARRCDALYLE